MTKAVKVRLKQVDQQEHYPDDDDDARNAGPRSVARPAPSLGQFVSRTMSEAAPAPDPDERRGGTAAPGLVLLVGASGLIGSAVAAALHREGYRVRAIVRGAGPTTRRVRADELVTLDLRSVVRPDDWGPYVDGVSTVVNCAGVLQDSSRDSTSAVHAASPSALYRACSRSGVRRVIHISALGVDRKQCTPFSATKHEIEQELRASDLEWIILRPSVVLGRPAYGGSALFRGLASLPVLPRMPDAGRLSVVQLDDVVETVIRLLRPDAPFRIAIDLAGPEALAFEEVVAHYRRWLGWPRARLLQPMPLLTSLAFRIGDVASVLGWRPPIRSTARREIARGAAGDPQAWSDLTGIKPKSLSEALADEPASVQERWFARLYLLKPLALVVFATFWLLTGFVSLGPGYDIGVELMREGGAGALSAPIVIAGGLADLVVGLGILWHRTARPALIGAIALTLFYVACGTAILPRLWEDPLGPMMKVWPILAFNFLLLAILDER
jgi:uncharacterized protein YbjT (DUF2867 family)